MKKILLFFILINSILYSQTDGSLDTSFGTNGRVFTDLSASSNDYMQDGIQLPDNKILVAGYTTLKGLDNVVLKYLPNGTLDVSFGTNGISIIEFGSDKSQIRKIATQSDGKIIIAGRSGSLTSYATVARLNSDGTLDTTFGTNGIVTKISGTESDIQSLHILPDNKIIVVGYVLNDNSDIQVIKLNADGSFDTNFGINGVAVIDFDSLSQRAFCSVMNGEKILIGGVVSNPTESSLLLQLNSNGSIDTTFGTNGYSSIQFGANPNDYYDRFLTVKVFQNKIYAVGSRAKDYFNYNINLSRFTIDGLLDTSFSDDGKLLIDTNNEKDFVQDLNILNDNSILLAGVSLASNSNKGFLMKLNANGSYKTNFGSAGVVTNMNFIEVQKVIVNQNNIIVVGTTTYPSNVALAKYNNANLLGIQNDEFLGRNFNVYPNPMQDKLNVISRSGQQINTIEILDASGKKVFEHNQNTDQLNTGNLAKGIYFLKIYSEGLIENFKLIKD
ncbi:T9SS type A sorting domain-containing protein [Flavobacterium limi]|uniref:Secretion system C-terminal sorting domain-containing protein n=1 Tax=Flavobacterium limi TaxID=2045105 RepID=A0ABQ1U0M8_9FLAO|nr:T9SS type A sorting domain-containing protein [Flavobacterium limi]GGF06373.1 hypothetical protein GCM10011518_14610 [Flavobacterium limi]